MKYLFRTIGFITALGLVTPVYADKCKDNKEEMKKNISTILGVTNALNDCGFKSHSEFKERLSCIKDWERYKEILQKEINQYKNCRFWFEISSDSQTGTKSIEFTE